MTEKAYAEHKQEPQALIGKEMVRTVSAGKAVEHLCGYKTKIETVEILPGGFKINGAGQNYRCIEIK